MLRTLAPWLVVLAVALTACGDDDDTAPDANTEFDATAPVPDAPPTGPGLTITGTLIVDNTGNTVVIANQPINLRIRIERGGDPVTNALIRIEPPGGVVTWLTGEAIDLSLYTGTYLMYSLLQTRIEINADDDEVPRITIVGQELFKITAPTASQSVPPGEDLVAMWSLGATASSLLVTTAGGYDSGELSDSATHTIPGAFLTKTTPEDEVIVLRCRRTDTLPGDATAGSYLDFCVQSHQSITVETP